MNADTIIIGAGAAGCYAAVTAAKLGKSVLLFEANDRIGHKLSITGKGRCNLTNDCDLDTLTANIPRNPRFLYSAFSNCMPQDVMDFFEAEGVPLKTERGRRVFPVSDSAADIVSALKQAMHDAGVRILHARVQKLCIKDGVCTGVIADHTEYYAESVLIATGGMSYPRTGSKGDGYRLARQAGHTIVSPSPSLIPLETLETDPKEMQGLSLKNVTLSVFSEDGDKNVFKEQGEMLFTHFGVSGPLILSASAVMDAEQAGRYRLSIDLKPALSHEQLDLRIQRDFSEMKNRVLGNALGKLLPASMIPVIIRAAGLSPELRIHDIKREERLSLGKTIKAYPLTVRAMRPIAEAIVTRGGVNVREIKPKTMESKLVPGLFFAGEVIDVDAFTGGYNLQIAFATGYTAGMNL